MFTGERQLNMDRLMKMGLASLLLVMILALGGLAVTGPSLDGGISPLLARANEPAQQIEANPAAVQVRSSNGATATTAQPGSTSTENAPAQPQAQGQAQGGL